MIKQEVVKKSTVRREFLKCKNSGLSYKQCISELEARFQKRYSIATLKRWNKRFLTTDWDLEDYSQKPKKIKYKYNKIEVGKILELRALTGYSAYQLHIKAKREGIFMHSSTIRDMIKKSGLSRGNKIEGKKLSWVLFERPDPNYMWQIDGTKIGNGKWLIPVEDDCSRYWIDYVVSDSNNTEVITKLLEKCISMHGKPLQILTDNGTEFGGNGKGNNMFDKWCRKMDILHIRSSIHKPETVGKISKLQFTISYELPYCYNDYEFCRWRYNHDRPHQSLNGLTPSQVYFGERRHKKFKAELL